MTHGSPQNLLEVDNLWVKIGSGQGTVYVLNGVSFTLEKGKTLAVVGESGSGKSMLCKAIMGLLPQKAEVPEKSVIRVLGCGTLSQLSQSELSEIRAKKIAMIFQDPVSSLNPVMKIGHQIAEPLRYRLGMTKKQARDRTFELMKSVEITLPRKRFHQYPHQLSGGMCQRVAIAVALSCSPDLLIADEPTTALDVTVQAEILDLLARIQSDKTMSMIFVTHDLGLAMGRADEIAVMYAGKIVEKGPAKALAAHPRMPYTKALFDSIVPLDKPPHTPLFSIIGRPPDPSEPLKGCAFAQRCSRAEQQCRNAEPEICFNEKQNHAYACFYPCIGECP